VRLPLDQDDQGRLSIGAERLAAARAERPRLLLFSHPNNPTGGVYDASTIQALAKFAVDEDLVVVVDQLYCRLIYGGVTYTHLGALPGMIERTVTLVGPSKTESMSGYRVGVAVGPPAAVDVMERVLSLSSLRAAAYCQQALRHWIVGDADWLAQRIAEHQELRDLLVERLRTIPGVSVASPAGSSYVFPLIEAPRWARNGDGPDDHEIAVAFKAAGVLVSPGYQFGPAGRGRFRINFSQDRERLLIAIERITTALS
jgi:aspartate/methionine/tyrosine aminotransferase